MRAVSLRRCSCGEGFAAWKDAKLPKVKLDIVQKLKKELAERITSERQVVYILVELRKLLEAKGALGNYKALNLCCDWTVHPKLDRKPAQEITKLFDEYEARYRREAVGVSQADMPELVDFCGHARFRAELIEACESNGISSSAPKNDDWWRSFLTQFSEIIRDCPLEAKADGTTYVNRVTASAMAPEYIGIHSRQFAICWTWYRKDIEAPGTVMYLF
jgi:hypothetical protein